VVALGLAALLALALSVPASASASAKPKKTPYLSVFSAKVKAGQAIRSYANFRMDHGGAWDDYEANYAWDDYESDAPSCKRVSRSAVDCKLRVQLFESDYEDPDAYTASEDCRWTLRFRRARGGGVSSYQLFEGGGSGGDIGSVECVGWYGDEGAESTNADADDYGDDYDYDDE
jgi:hypothetical protein